MTELRVTVPDEIAERLASEAAERGTSAEEVAAEVLVSHVPAASKTRSAAVVGGSCPLRTRRPLRASRGDPEERARPNRLIVVDTGPLVALLDADDRHHEHCRTWLAANEEPLFVPVPVVTETCYFIERDSGPRSKPTS